MSTRKLRVVENLILLTFPVVLFAGCAGSDVKPAQQKQTQMMITKNETPDQSFTYTETDSPVVFELNSDSVIEKMTDTKESTRQETDSQIVEKADDIEDTALITTPEKKIFFFDTNHHQLSEDQRKELKQHAEYLLANPGAMLVINGHADVRGTENYNQSLSEKRASETFKVLTELGVPENQLLTNGFGEMVPMNEENNWDENRRVELQYTDNVMLSSM